MNEGRKENDVIPLFQIMFYCTKHICREGVNFLPRGPIHLDKMDPAPHDMARLCNTDLF
jgi:hypothetical protein